MKKKAKVAFVCVHNSCRSQMAEAISKIIASEDFDSYSAGTEVKPQINSDAVSIIKELYDVDMTQTQYSKLIDELPEIDVVITMGCNVTCPNLPCLHREDWGLEDPSNKNRDAFLETVKQIEIKIHKLKETIKNF